jgi:HEAT repeat protein
VAHAFISYVRENSVVVDRLAAALRELGIDIWLDREQIAAGSRWRHAIRNAIREGTCFVACFSAEAQARNRTYYMNEELVEAIEELRLRPANRNWFIPVLLSPCEVPEMSIGAGDTLHSIQSVALYESWDAGVLRIAEAIEPISVAVKRYVDQLANQSARKRIAAADALGNMGPVAKESISALASALHDENATVQAAATQAIGKIGTPTSEILRTLKQLVAEGDYYVKSHASRVLAMIGDHEAIPLLVKNLDDNDARVRTTSARALGLLGSAAAIAAKPLIAALRDQDVQVRDAAASALKSMPNSSEAAIPELIRLLNDEDKWDRSKFEPPNGFGASDRVSAAMARGSLGERAHDAVPHLIESLFDSDSYLRRISAFVLGEIGGPSAVPALQRSSVEDQDPQVRDLASLALKKLKP